MLSMCRTNLTCATIYVYLFALIYVLHFNGEQIQTESGAKAKANKTGIYKKWKERSHSKISLRGNSNEGNIEEATSLAGKPTRSETFCI